jgi:hypothetical protein
VQESLSVLEIIMLVSIKFLRIDGDKTIQNNTWCKVSNVLRSPLSLLERFRTQKKIY